MSRGRGDMGGRAPFGRKNRTESSNRWLRRQQSDPYVQRAKAEGYRSRSAYKLLELDASIGLLKPGATVIDLGSAPGGWLQVAAAKRCRIVGIDLLPVEPVTGADILAGDFTDAALQEAIRAKAAGPVHLVMSDMAANATGTRAVDRLRAEGLAEAVLAFAFEVLAPDGAVVIKLVKGAEANVIQTAKPAFGSVRLVRPPATRRDSSEVYLVATRFRGVRPDTPEPA
ncbi:RlmE family RNA methyltransferase [Marinivivus vitaminiproducens]|uniref:RlmE family RNA methyltransferase n=1 Tax=Marinivivus vitaminiproducens TaxID=3035935 RepID=UPI00279AE857|nr:RlmE family RNA methyltransferase [Geminicoccaceae bacterium SCSIO 64248]